MLEKLSGLRLCIKLPVRCAVSSLFRQPVTTTVGRCIELDTRGILFRYFSSGKTLCSERTVNKTVEKSSELKLKKEANRQLRLDRQRIRQEKESQKAKVEISYQHNGDIGSKKDTKSPLLDSYSPQYVEAAWYDWWQNEGFFTPEYTERQQLDGNVPRKRFVICLPPPNVTGSLHLGHAMGGAVEDAIVRWHRMCGRMTLWNPGCDHAGIATQTVVEKKMWNERKLTRHQVGRQQFINEVNGWKDEKIEKIYSQMKRMGLSLDWNRACFTLDAKLNHAVNEAFIRLFESGTIYRSKRLVNWSCALQSAISDIEVENVSLKGRTVLSVPGYDRPIPFGTISSFAYPIAESGETITVATTRLETMLGDVAVAVNPNDGRYLHLHGKFVRHPFDLKKLLPIVTDESIDMSFGTGAMKVTPAHDPNDFELAKRHDLPHHNILNDDGTLVNVPSEFLGKKRFTAREMVENALVGLGLFRGAQEHVMTVPICSRSNDVIEYLLKDQWFVRCEEMSRKAIEAVTSGRLELIPGHYEKQWKDWLLATRDWCISRQLWWGHRVPAYKLQSSESLPASISSSTATTSENGELWVSAHSEAEAKDKISWIIQQPATNFTVVQDTDVLDTWFSSGLFPFSIFGWPDTMTADYCKFYPTDLLETASDIMFFWVARMVMLGEQLTGQLPFKQVLFHSIVRDAQGRKMSKSLGNVIDPMHVIGGISLQELVDAVEQSNLSKSEIAKAKQGLKADYPLGISQCGADALRFTLCSYNFTGHVVNVDVSHMKANRHFCNKIWQAFRFFKMNVPDCFQPVDISQLQHQSSATDQWMLSRLSNVVNVCNVGFNTYDLTSATRSLYAFWWTELCDVYLEYVKYLSVSQRVDELSVSKSILCLCVQTGLKLLSPFMPFLTEELYQRLPDCCDKAAPSITVSAYPQPEEFPFTNAKVEHEMNTISNILSFVLQVRKDLNLTKAKPVLYVESVNSAVCNAIEQHLVALLTLSRSQQINVVSGCVSIAALADCVSVTSPDGSYVLHFQLRGLINAEETIDELLKRKNRIDDDLLQLGRSTTRASVDDDNDKRAKAELALKLSRLQNLMMSLSKLT